MNILFTFREKRDIVKNPTEAIEFINSIGHLTCNEHTIDNINRMFNNECKVWGYHNQNESPINKDGYTFESIATTGIGKERIFFCKTECNTMDEVIEKEKAYEERVKNIRIFVKKNTEDLAKQVKKILNKKSKSCVDIFSQSDLCYVLRIGQNGYWCSTTQSHGYIEEYFTHFNPETLISEDGKNIVELLKSYL